MTGVAKLLNILQLRLAKTREVDSIMRLSEQSRPTHTIYSLDRTPSAQKTILLISMRA